jgi:hypothetical protein
MTKDKLPPHRFGPGFDPLEIPHALGHRGDNPSMVDLAKRTTNPFKQYIDHSRVLGSGKASYMAPSGNTHSIPIRPHPHGHAIAKSLLHAGDDKVASTVETDHRPLIDKLHEATFDPNCVGLQFIKDKYALRGLLRKAKCFTIDDATSEMIADFSVAISSDLDGARRMAIPPFPVTWIDHNNAKRIARIQAMGGKLTPQAAGYTRGAVVERVGWLIWPADIGGHFMLYFTHVDQGLIMAPLAFWWHNGQHRAISLEHRDPEMDHFLHGLTLGVMESNCDPADAYPSPTPLHIDLKGSYKGQIRELMVELAGELRHVWGLLIAIASSHFGVEPRMADQAPHTDIRKMPNGKPLLPLEHKTLHLHLRRKTSPEKVFLRGLTHHKHRWHEVRAHLRTLRNADGSVRKIIPIPKHERGDEKLGKIIRDETKVEL